jgi:hypothetical protein
MQDFQSVTFIICDDSNIFAVAIGMLIDYITCLSFESKFDKSI